MAQLASRPQSQSFLRRYRWQELGLLIIPFLILLLEMIQLLLANLDPNSSLNIRNLPLLDGLTPIFGLIAALIATNIVLSIFFRKADQVLLPLVGLLSGLGVLMMTRLGPDIPRPLGPIPNMGSRQLAWVLVGLVICIGTMFLLRNTTWLSRYKYTWILFCFAVLLPSLIKGVLTFKSANSTPTRDILNLGPLSLQPSEFLKIGLVIFFAGYLNDNRDMLAQGYFRLGGLKLPPLKQLGPLVLMLGVALMIFLVVRELGLAMLIYSLFLCMTYLATGKMTYVLVSLSIFAVLAFVGYSLLTYVKLRFATVSVNVVDWTAASEAAYQGLNGAFQVIQGLIALSSGGIIGAGLGLGSSATFVPVADADMVFTSFGEEIGLVGLFAIIGIYMLLIHRGFRIAAEATDPFNKLLAAGLTSVFAIQTLIISAGNLKIMPLTGIPLPFLSNGGNSILANFIIVGILLRISHNTAVEREGLF